MAEFFSTDQPLVAITDSRRRYPGIRSFERAEAGQFFGREREAQSLFEAVKVKPLTVLFAKSGIGKSSLINAGLVPFLENDGFLPVSIRLQNTDSAPVETVRQALLPFLNPAKLAAFGGQPASLWDWARSCDFGQKEGIEMVPVLIFDQFEELFQHEKNSRDELTLALADLLHERLPDDVRVRLRAVPMAERTEEFLAWHEPLRLKALFSIRSDRMSELDQLKNRIPTVLHDRFHLKPLSYENARAAIAEPAALRGMGFWSKPFSYSPEAMQTILEALDNEQGEIESFQLQLLCGFLEQKMMEKATVFSALPSPATSRTAAERMVKTDDFGGAEGIEKILNDYYERELSQLSTDEQLAARRLIEEGLIIDGRRVGVPEGAERERFGIGEDLLKKLLDSRLLRSEQIHLGKIYELSHDTLIEPIRASFEKRKTAENSRRLEAERAAERNRLEEVLQKRRRARGLAIAGFVLAGVAAIAGFFAFLNGKKAEKARSKAETTALATKAWSMYREDHTLAFRIAEAAWRQDTTNAEALQTMREIVNEPTTTFYKTVFSRHVFEVTDLDFSPDDSLVASGGFDGDVFVWTKTGQVVYRFRGKNDGEEFPGHSPQNKVFVRFTPGGQRLVSAGGDRLVKIWSLAGDSLLNEFSAHRKRITCLDLAPDSTILTGSLDSTACLWSPDGRLLQTLRGHAELVSSAVFSKDGQLILTGSSDGTARLWNWRGSCLRTFSTGGPNVNSVAISPDGQTVGLGCSDNSARLFHINGRPVSTLGGHSAQLSRVRFSPDGRYFLTASNDHSAKLWTLGGEEVLRLIGHTERLDAAAFSGDGKWLATGGFDFTAKIWNLEFNLQNRLSRHTNYANKARFSPDGASVFSSSSDFTLKKWNLDGAMHADLRGHKSGVTSFDISPDGQMLISTSNDRTIRLWRTDSSQTKTIQMGKSDALAAVFLPDGHRFVASDFGGKVAVFDIKTGLKLREWVATDGRAIQSLTVSPDGQRVFTADAAGFLKAFSINGDTVWSAQNEAAFWYVSVSPDGQRLATAGNETPVKIWNAANGQLLTSLFGHLDANYCVGWSPDGLRVVSSNWDRLAKIWSLDGQCLFSLPHPDGVNGAAFSPDGERVVTACRDKLVRVWDARTGQLQATLGGERDPRGFMASTEIAPLSSIAFDWEKYGISPALAAVLYRDSPENIVRRGLQLLAKSAATIGNRVACLRYADEAEAAFIEAQKNSTTQPGSTTTARFDSLRAEVFSIRANTEVIARNFAGALEAARAGMKHQPLQFLKIYEINCLLLLGRFDEAIRLAQAVRDEPVTEIGFYIGGTMGEAIEQELATYTGQYGIDVPDLERFVSAISAK